MFKTLALLPALALPQAPMGLASRLPAATPAPMIGVQRSLRPLPFAEAVRGRLPRAPLAPLSTATRALPAAPERFLRAAPEKSTPEERARIQARKEQAWRKYAEKIGPAADPWVKMAGHKGLSEFDRDVIENRLAHADAEARTPELEMADRLRALAFIAQTAILAAYDRPAKLLAENRLARLRFTMGAFSIHAKDAYESVLQYQIPQHYDRERQAEEAKKQKNFMMASVLRFQPSRPLSFL